jgi:hypothetical protein
MVEEAMPHFIFLLVLDLVVLRMQGRVKGYWRKQLHSMKLY